MSGERGTHSGEAQPRIRVLGPVTVDGQVVTRAQRAILCALALRPGAAFSTETLVDAVWPLEVPASARSSLQNQLARLRRTFGEDLIETARDGYRLRGSTDVQAFESAAADGCASGVTPRRAVGLLTGATALWRGRPFEALVDHPEADCEATRLLALRQRVDEHLGAARIALGDGDRAISELEVLVEVDPYRERPWELLMRALDSVGRRCEALAAYERMSTRLRDELGVAPSQYLSQLRDLISAGSSVDAPEFGDPEFGTPMLEGQSVSTRAGESDAGTGACNGTVPIRRRGRCGTDYRTQRTWGGAE